MSEDQRFWITTLEESDDEDGPYTPIEGNTTTKKFVRSVLIEDTVEVRDTGLVFESNRVFVECRESELSRLTARLSINPHIIWDNQVEKQQPKKV